MQQHSRGTDWWATYFWEGEVLPILTKIDQDHVSTLEHPNHMSQAWELIKSTRQRKSTIPLPGPTKKKLPNTVTIWALSVYVKTPTNSLRTPKCPSAFRSAPSLLLTWTVNNCHQLTPLGWPCTSSSQPPQPCWTSPLQLNLAYFVCPHIDFLYIYFCSLFCLQGAS